MITPSPLTSLRIFYAFLVNRYLIYFLGALFYILSPHLDKNLRSEYGKGLIRFTPLNGPLQKKEGGPLLEQEIF